MQNTVLLSPELQEVIDRKAAEIDMTAADYIADFLMVSFADELNEVAPKSQVDTFLRMRHAITEFKALRNKA